MKKLLLGVLDLLNIPLQNKFDIHDNYCNVYLQVNNDLHKGDRMSQVDYKQVAADNNVSEAELLALVAGRTCPVYPNEPLFVLRGRGGKLQVRPISKKAHVERMQAARKNKS